jgi:hypothetical protein
MDVIVMLVLLEKISSLTQCKLQCLIGVRVMP